MSGLNGHAANGTGLLFAVDPEPVATVATVPTPTPVALKELASGQWRPGVAFSPSQLNTFMSCPAKWMYKYLLDVPDRSNGTRHLGKSFHKGTQYYFDRKLAEPETPIPAADVLEAYEIAWDQGAEEVDFTQVKKGDETAEEMKATGGELLQVYLKDTAPRITPAAVEKPIAGEIAGIPVRGFIDVIDVHGIVIDSKTAAKAPNGLNPGYVLQVTSYTILDPAAKGARLDTITKTKTIKAVEQTVEVGPADVQYATTLLPIIQNAVKDGAFYPRRESFLCSRKYCPFVDRCIKEFGGRVD